MPQLETHCIIHKKQGENLYHNVQFSKEKKTYILITNLPQKKNEKAIRLEIMSYSIHAIKISFETVKKKTEFNTNT